MWLIHVSGRQGCDINPTLTHQEKEHVKNVLRENHYAFAYGNRSLGNSDILKMDIDTSDAKPISQPPYHASPNACRIIEENIAQLLSDDVIEESDSPWAAPAILVHQKGKDRFCIDYRKLNEVTKADQYPFPELTTSFHSSPVRTISPPSMLTKASIRTK
jgi:hypothetical protein